MSVKKLKKFLVLYERGVMSAREVADEVLYNIVADGDVDDELFAYLASIPATIKVEFDRLFRSIAEANFRWAPEFFGGSNADPTRFSPQLKKLGEMLSVNHGS